MSIFDYVPNDWQDSELSNEAMVKDANWRTLNSTLFPDLAAVIEKHMPKSNARNMYNNKDLMLGIPEVIKKHTGINVVIDPEYPTFAVIPPDVNKNHVLNDTIRREYFKSKDLKKFKDLKGDVDIVRFKVSGDFAKIPIKLFLDPNLMYSGRMSAKHIAAVILHETGHMFSYFALCADLLSYNVPLMATIDRLTKAEGPDEISYVLTQYNNNSDGSRISVEELKGKSKKTVITAVIQHYAEKNTSVSRDLHYDSINSEYLADNFTSRVGAASYQVEALDIIYSIYGHRNRGGLGTFLAYEFMHALITLFFTALFAVTIFTVIYPIYIALIFGPVIVDMHSNTHDGTYDTIKRRYERIREDLIAMLKAPDVDKMVGQRLREDIARIDDILKNYNDYKSIAGRLVDFVIPTLRKRKTQAEFYTELEKFSNNDLHIAVHDLKSLT